MFKMKRREDDDSKLPPLKVSTELKLSTHRGLEKFSTFDTILRESTRHRTKSPRRSIDKTRISKIHNKPKVASIPFIVKHYNKKVPKHRIDRSRKKDEMANCMSLVDNLIKKQRLFV